MDSRKTPHPPFPVSRYFYFGDFRFYYGYGNTPPDDYLENASGISEPSVLLLGCGDIRSCLYTLWKNFGSSHGSRFNGVHFVLNDISAAILARDVLFLYLCLKMPSEKERMKEWICAVWAIWFCHELLPGHDAILNNALSSLIKFSSSMWSSKGNPLHSLVKFTSPQVLREICQVWKMWRDKDVRGVKSVENMNSARKAEQSVRFTTARLDNERVATEFVDSAVGSRSGDISTEARNQMAAEAKSYLRKGSVFAEEIINRSVVVTKTVVNYTLFERRDGRYTLHYTSVPFKCFYHSFQYSEKHLKKLGVPKRYHKCLMVSSNCFDTHPLLANSIQQLAMWFQTCAGALNEARVTFTLHCSDAIEFCQVLQSTPPLENLSVVNKFDLIDASNLLDHLAPPNLVLSALPLLKPSGHLFTLTLTYKGISQTAEEYILACFGFESKFLPVLFGVRCINHEGRRYSSVVSTLPIPVEGGNVGLRHQWPKMLIWEKVWTQPQKMSSLADCESTVTIALCLAVNLCATRLLLGTKGGTTMNNLCLETAIKMLQTYALILDADVSSYQFWLPLCKQLLRVETMEPFLHALQTQCILHNLHLHLTVSDQTCPMCKSIPIAECVYQCSFKVSLPFQTEFTPCFMAFVHKAQIDTAIQLHLQVASGMDVHIFDSLAGNVDGNTLTLTFYCPESLAKEGYTVTLVSYTLAQVMFSEANIPRVVTHRELAKCCTPKIAHSFQKTDSSPTQSVASNFGSVVSHSGDGDNFETILQLSDAMLEAGTSVSTKQLSSSEIEISCGTLKHNVHYPHPIEYNRLAVKISRKKQNVTILSSRAAHNFEEDNALFSVNPENQLSLPPVIVSPEAYTTSCGLQYSKQERDIMEACRSEISLMPPMVCLKQTITTLFQCRDRVYFHITVPGSPQHHRALIVIQRCLFDIQHKTPAIDLAFCLLEESFLETLLSEWGILSSLNSRGVPTTEGEYKLLVKVLTYFSKRTVSSLKSSKGKGEFKRLFEHHIDRYFTRAVVYPLYSDPDAYVLGLDLTKPATETSETSSQQNKTAQSKEAAVPLNSCSHCGKQQIDLKKCTKCDKVQYCGRDCQRKHWKEHKPSCSNPRDTATASLPTSSNKRSEPSASMSTERVESAVSLKKCSNCDVQSADLKKCTKCGRVQYCGRDCQRKHWKEHKSDCHREPSTVEEVTASPGLNTAAADGGGKGTPSSPPFPVARYVYNGDRVFYYGYGNTPPDDYLENASGISEPSVLILGCGDIRSCLYTLWRNFGSSHSSRFNGVHFVLNDNSAAVLARDVLFLYLCLKMPSEKERIKEWLCAVWAIWFCHELLPEHDAILNNALSSLIKFSSSTWSSKGNPLHSLVKFTSPHVLSEICQVWKMWRDKDVRRVKSVDDMNSARRAEQVRTHIKETIDDGKTASYLVASAVGTIKAGELSTEKQTCMESEVNSYYNIGSAFIEPLVRKTNGTSTDTIVNHTLYERKDGLYTLHYASVPFKCFFHSFQFSPKQLEDIKAPKALTADLLIMDSGCFESHPLLANSAQQFALWFKACAQVFRQENCPNISFTIHCSDAIEFCQVLSSANHAGDLNVEREFDLIYTSNLIDFLSPPNLVLSAISLLKKSGYLFTLTLLYKSIASTADKYLNACFGFESNLLPILFGIRCINHEGGKYSSVVTAQLIPWELGNSGYSQHFPKLLIWEKVDMHPQKLPTLTDCSKITAALCSSVYFCSTPLLVPRHECSCIDSLTSLCTETVVKVLISFAAILDADVTNYKFWSPLCELVLRERPLTPFLHALQTQCLLHGLHLHLTVTEDMCPICTTLPVTRDIWQFSLEVCLPLQSHLSPCFMAFVHETNFKDVEHLHCLALLGDGVHIFDCLAGSTDESKLRLNFYCPRMFAEKEYDVTLVSYTKTRKHGELQEFTFPCLLVHKKLARCHVSDRITHYFHKVELPPVSVSSLLGSVASHSGDGDSFETVLQLSDATLSKLTSGTSVTANKVSPSEIIILCGNIEHNVLYPHPVDYNTLSIIISRKQKSITVLASRAAHNFEEENPFFQVTATNFLSLPPFFVGKDAMINYSCMQFTKQDQEVMNACRREPTLMPPIVNLKETINLLFQSNDEHFFHVVLPVGGVHGLLVVQNHVFDYQTKTPALDLAFCFLDFPFGQKVCTEWQKLLPVSFVRDIRVDNKEYGLLQRVFNFFSRRTNVQKPQSARGNLQLLEKHHIAQYFSRAVIYPLYSDPDSLEFTEAYRPDPDTDSSHESSVPWPNASTGSVEPTVSLKKCANCNVQSSDLKKCAKCLKVQYCSRDCQRKHWKEHKPSCSNPPDTTTASLPTGSHQSSEPSATIESDSLSKCDGCGGMFAKLKKCPCHQVAYCSVACQKKEWTKHKTVCSNRLPKH